MKKVFLISLLCCLLFGLVACNTLPRDDTTTTSSEDTTTNSPYDDIIIDYDPVKSLTSLEEYQQYLETAELPEGFITYEQLSWIGNCFDVMRYRTEDTTAFPFHSYYLISTTQEEIFGYKIGCYYNGEFPLDFQDYTLHSLEEMPKDLRTIPMDGVVLSNPLSGVRLIYNDNLQYVYDSRGKLILIIMEIDGVCITLEGAYYRASQCVDPVVDPFLDRDTAEAAYENFAAHIRGTAVGE